VFWATVDNKKQDNKKIRQLKSTLDQIDTRRGTNWRKLWPWLDEYEV